MKRFHVHMAVTELDEAIRFYSALFGQSPARVEADYAKWMLEDPAGIRWETFHTFGLATSYGDPQASPAGAACCAQRQPAGGTCCG